MANDLDRQIAAEIGRITDEIMRLRKDDDYVVNPEQMGKFLELVKFFHRRLDGKPTATVKTEKFEPKFKSGSVTASFILFDVNGDMVAEFCKVLSACSVIQISHRDDSAMISCTVPDVFVRDKK